MKKFVCNYHEIEAVQYIIGDADSWNDIVKLGGGIKEGTDYITITNLDGITEFIRPNDWIVKRGTEVYVIPNHIFVLFYVPYDAE